MNQVDNRTTEAQVQDMFAQSVQVLSRPSPMTFERFEKRGGIPQAAIYVLLAAVISGLVAGFFAMMPFHQDVTFFGQLFKRLITIPVGFGVFTGLVYFIGQGLFRGTGTYPEVAYSFALFYVPIAILGTFLTIIPVFNFFFMPLFFLVYVFYGYLAVQSSMNLRDTVSSAATLILSGLGYLVITGLLFRLLGN